MSAESQKLESNHQCMEHKNRLASITLRTLSTNRLTKLFMLCYQYAWSHVPPSLFEDHITRSTQNVCDVTSLSRPCCLVLIWFWVCWRPHSLNRTHNLCDPFHSNIIAHCILKRNADDFIQSNVLLRIYSNMQSSISHG